VLLRLELRSGSVRGGSSGSPLADVFGAAAEGEEEMSAVQLEQVRLGLGAGLLLWVLWFSWHSSGGSSEDVKGARALLWSLITPRPHSAVLTTQTTIHTTPTIHNQPPGAEIVGLQQI